MAILVRVPAGLCRARSLCRDDTRKATICQEEPVGEPL
jgi:hypothetical protein